MPPLDMTPSRNCAKFMNVVQQKKSVPARFWLGLSGVFVCLFAVCTGVLASGALSYPAMRVEQWLLRRPLMPVDCTFSLWRSLGDPLASLLFTLLLGVLCLALGYRRRVVFFLVMLLAIGISIELLSKDMLYQPVPLAIRSGLTSLSCSQLAKKPKTEKLLIGLGAWWIAPPPLPQRVKNARVGATVPLAFNENAYAASSYPSGHAARWGFLGLLAYWLSWRWIRRRLLRALLMALALAVAFGGGFLMFYTGLHLVTDLIGGYLLGAALACCAIALLLQHEKTTVVATSPAPEQDSLKAGV